MFIDLGPIILIYIHLQYIAAHDDIPPRPWARRQNSLWQPILFDGNQDSRVVHKTISFTNRNEFVDPDLELNSPEPTVSRDKIDLGHDLKSTNLVNDNPDSDQDIIDSLDESIQNCILQSAIAELNIPDNSQDETGAYDEHDHDKLAEFTQNCILESCIAELNTPENSQAETGAYDDHDNEIVSNLTEFILNFILESTLTELNAAKTCQTPVSTNMVNESSDASLGETEASSCKSQSYEEHNQDTVRSLVESVHTFILESVLPELRDTRAQAQLETTINESDPSEVELNLQPNLIERLGIASMGTSTQDGPSAVEKMMTELDNTIASDQGEHPLRECAGIQNLTKTQDPTHQDCSQDPDDDDEISNREKLGERKEPHYNALAIQTTISHDSSSSGTKKHLIPVIYVSGIIGAFIVMIAIYVYYLHHRRRLKMKWMASEDKERSITDHDSDTERPFSTFGQMQSTVHSCSKAAKKRIAL